MKKPKVDSAEDPGFYSHCIVREMICNISGNSLNAEHISRAMKPSRRALVAACHLRNRTYPS